MLDPIDDFFVQYPETVQVLSRKLRAMVKSAMPQANELLFASQNHVAYSYSHSSNETICYVCPLKDYVRLGFMFGSHLPDPDQILVGEGKRLRHVKVRTVESADTPALESLVITAWADAITHMKKNS